jgi:hypothetical protein
MAKRRVIAPVARPTIRGGTLRIDVLLMLLILITSVREESD